MIGLASGSGRWRRRRRPGLGGFRPQADRAAHSGAHDRGGLAHVAVVDPPPGPELPHQGRGHRPVRSDAALTARDCTRGASAAFSCLRRRHMMRYGVCQTNRAVGHFQTSLCAHQCMPTLQPSHPATDHADHLPPAVSLRHHRRDRQLEGVFHGDDEVTVLLQHRAADRPQDRPVHNPGLGLSRAFALFTPVLGIPPLG